MAYQMPGRSSSVVQPVVGPGNELYDTLARSSPTFVGKLFRTIDTPARTLREFLTGKKNATGDDIIRQAGLRTGNGIVDTVTGLGAEMLLDPLNAVTFGTGAAGKAARAARAANILDDAPRAVSRMLVDSGEAAAKFSDSPSWTNFFSPDSIGTRAANTFKKAGFTDDLGEVAWNKVTDNDLYARPLVGNRQAVRRSMPGTNRQMTLGDLVNAQEDSAKALQDIQNFAKRNRTSADSLMKQNLYKDVGIGLPFGDPLLSFNVPGGEATANLIDLMGSGFRHSAAGRRAHQFFDKSVRGTKDDVEQLIARRLSRADDLATKAAAGKVSDLISSADPRLVELSRSGVNGRVLRSLIEGNYDLHDWGKIIQDTFKNANDRADAVKSLNAMMSPEMAGARDQAVGNIRSFFRDYLKESRDAGIKSAALQDKYGNEYLGRILDRSLYPDLKAAGVGSSPKSVLTGDMQARGNEFTVPGGTNTLTDLSGQSFIRDKSLSDKQVAEEVYQFIKAKEGKLKQFRDVPKELEYTRGNAMKLARKLRAMDPAALDDGKRLFAQNPFEIIDKYATGRQRAMARAGELQTLMAQTAKNGYRSQMAGGGYKSVTQMARDLGMESKRLIGPMPEGVARPYSSGAARNIIDTMQEFGIDVDDQTLRRFSVDPELQKRLKNISEFYKDNRSKTEFGKAIGAITRNFKQWVLAIPRRYSRDWYSGLFSNFVTHPHANDLYRGYDVTKDVMQGRWDAAAQKLKKIPRYEGYTDEQLISIVRKEMAEAGMSQTGRLNDVGYENIAREQGRDTFAKYLGGDGRPVTTPAYAAWDTLTGQTGRPSIFGDAYAGSELKTTRNWTQDWLPVSWDKGTILENIKFNDTGRTTRNPILRASARAAETTDEINRLGGYFAMLFGGYNPEAAATAITRAQIDYSSLTPFERKYLGVLFPFWAYLSRVSKWGVGQMLENQTYFNSAIRTPLTLSGNRGDQYSPTRIEERYGVKISDDFINSVPDVLKPMLKPLLGSNVEGNTYLSDIDIPFVDSLLMVDPVVDPDTGSTSVTKTLGATAQSLASQTNPMIKFAVESLTGRDLYTKTELDPTRRTLPTLARRAGVSDAATQEAIGFFDPLLSTILPATTYPMSTARRVTSEKNTLGQGIAQAGFNALAGTRIETIGPEEEIRDIRERISRFLKASPYAREMNMTYIPESQKEFAPQRILDLNELDKQLQKKSRELRDRRVGGNPLLTY